MEDGDLTVTLLRKINTVSLTLISVSRPAAIVLSLVGFFMLLHKISLFLLQIKTCNASCLKALLVEICLDIPKDKPTQNERQQEKKSIETICIITVFSLLLEEV